jgi:hypothetical protein
LALTDGGTVMVRCVQQVGWCFGGEMTSGRVRFEHHRDLPQRAANLA